MGGCYDSFEGEGSLEAGNIPISNVTIEQLQAMLESESLLIYDDMVVSGAVTSTDQNGNFYKTFLIQQNGYGLEVLEGIIDSYIHHDVGSVVTLKLQGLMIAKYREVLQVGLESATGSYYTLDYLEAAQIIDKHIFNSYTYSEIEPYIITIPDLTETICGRLVCVESLLHIPDEDATQPYTWGGYQQFIDTSGNSIWCYTSDYANFSLLEIPGGRLSLNGILQKGSISGVSGDQYMLEMRGVYDCKE